MLILRYILFALLTLYWVGIFVLTHLPAAPRVGPEVGDKTAHFLAYASLAGSLYVTWWVANPRRRFMPLWALAVVLAYGAFDEITQPLVGRVCELGDWLADAAGAGAAVGVMSVARWVVERWGWAEEDGREETGIPAAETPGN